MKILGIDPGLNVCGYACIEADEDEKILEAGVLRTDTSEPIEFRLQRIAEDIEELIQKLCPDVVAVEQLYSHYSHPRTAILMGHARGVILQKCAQANIKVRSFSATRIKKAVTGNGRATKEQVQKAVQTIMSLPQIPQPSDVADAMAVALCCVNSRMIAEKETL